MPKGYPKKLTEADEQFIVDNYLNYPVKRIATMLDCSQTMIKSRMKQKNLIIPAEIIQQRKKASQFKKGNISFNKGKKQEEYMTAEGIENSRKTSFKKGNIPENYKPVGSERLTIDGFLMVKIAEPRTWKLKNRYLYEKHHNVVLKKTELIRFKDGNKYNFNIDNLEKVSLQENMLLNSKHQIPKEIVKTIVLINKIKKTITS